MAQARRFQFVACIDGFARTGVPAIDRILEKTVGAPEAVLFDPEAKIPRRWVGTLFRSFTEEASSACSEYRGMGWRAECRVLPWLRAYAYEVHMEGSVNGEWWVIHEVFAYFLDGDVGKTWLVLAWTSEVDKAFRAWLAKWVREWALGLDDCTWWLAEARPSLGGNYEVVSREPKP